MFWDIVLRTEGENVEDQDKFVVIEIVKQCW